MAKETDTQVEDLKDFKWESTGDFFGVPGSAVEPVTPAKEKDDEDDDETPANLDDKDKKDKGKNPPAPADEKAKTEKEEEPFQEVNTEKEGDDPEDKEFFKTLAGELKEKGVLRNVNFKEDEEITEDRFFELQDEEIESRVEEAFQSFVTEVGDEGAAFIKFVKAGGKTRDFFAAMSTTAQVPEADITTEEGQNAILRYYYKHIEKLDDEDVQDRIDWATENNKREKYAEKYDKQIKASVKAAEQTLLKQQEDAKEEAVKRHKAFVTDISTTLTKTEQVGNFKFSSKDKKELTNYITSPSVQTKGGVTTQLSADINKLFMSEDKSKLLLLAKLIKSDFDITDLVNEVQTKVAQKTRTALNTQRNTSNPASSNEGKSKSLADFFN